MSINHLDSNDTTSNRELCSDEPDSKPHSPCYQYFVVALQPLLLPVTQQPVSSSATHQITLPSLNILNSNPTKFFTKCTRSDLIDAHASNIHTECCTEPHTQIWTKTDRTTQLRKLQFSCCVKWAKWQLNHVALPCVAIPWSGFGDISDLAELLLLFPAT